MHEELKDVLKLYQQSKKEKETAAAAETSALRESRMAIMNSRDLQDVVIGAVDGPQLPARYDPSGRIFYPNFIINRN